MSCFQTATVLQRSCRNPEQNRETVLNKFQQLASREPPRNPVKCFEVLASRSRGGASPGPLARNVPTLKGRFDCSGICSDTTSKKVQKGAYLLHFTESCSTPVDD